LSIVRSRNACPGHETSSIPLASRTTAWKMRSPLRVGRIPLEMTRPMTVTSIPGATAEIGVMVLASS